MSKLPEPIALIEAKGNAHMSKAEIEQRREQELKVPYTDVTPPEWLNDEQKEKFLHYADMLVALGIMTELDSDCLARYIMSFDLYLLYTKQLKVLLEIGDFEGLKPVQTMQDKMFKQAQASARDLGLTITSRCKIVVPTPPSTDDDEL